MVFNSIGLGFRVLGFSGFEVLGYFRFWGLEFWEVLGCQVLLNGNANDAHPRGFKITQVGSGVREIRVKIDEGRG